MAPSIGGGLGEGGGGRMRDEEGGGRRREDEGEGGEREVEGGGGRGKGINIHILHIHIPYTNC